MKEINNRAPGGARRTAPNDFQALVDASLSRRRFLKHSGNAAMGLFLAGAPLSRLAAANADSHTGLIGFQAMPASTADDFRVPPGYLADKLISWGDPVLPDAPDFDPSGNQDSSAQLGQFGDNTDGMSLFELSADRALLAVNNEFTNYEYLFSHGGEDMTADDVTRAQFAHGVSIVEIVRDAQGSWRYARASGYNRRITTRTPMEITGPAAGHEHMKTQADPSGRHSLGTLNNCSSGRTPWGTYMTCEENFHFYFAASSETEITPRQARYGLRNADVRYQWYLHDERFDLAKESNEANRFGWVVEIDPYDPEAIPLKRTALGRIKHENAAMVVNDDGRVVVYMGDDERGEHIYRFVSRDLYSDDPEANAPGGANRNLLENGTLYVARFEADNEEEYGELKGSGSWVELTHGKNGLTAENGFADQAEVLIYAREAATLVGATTMDRPEWVVVHPDRQSVFCTLTNNAVRGRVEEQPLNASNPRRNNIYGQIVRWSPLQGDHAADDFEWDLFVLAGNPVVHSGNLKAGSNNVTPENMFNSPDGLGFDDAGRLWIQTDGNDSNEGEFWGMGNNQMLCADPNTGEIRRFATGPVGCEVTGIAFSPDQRTVFVGVQHPGSGGRPSSFPGGGNSKPRSTIMAVRREDGGIIGT